MWENASRSYSVITSVSPVKRPDHCYGLGLSILVFNLLGQRGKLKMAKRKRLTKSKSKRPLYIAVSVGGALLAIVLWTIIWLVFRGSDESVVQDDPADDGVSLRDWPKVKPEDVKTVRIVVVGSDHEERVRSTVYGQAKTMLDATGLTVVEKDTADLLVMVTLGRGQSTGKQSTYIDLNHGTTHREALTQSWVTGTIQFSLDSPSTYTTFSERTTYSGFAGAFGKLLFLNFDSDIDALLALLGQVKDVESMLTQIDDPRLIEKLTTIRDNPADERNAAAASVLENLPSRLTKDALPPNIPVYQTPGAATSYLADARVLTDSSSERLLVILGEVEHFAYLPPGDEGWGKALRSNPAANPRNSLGRPELQIGPSALKHLFERGDPRAIPYLRREIEDYSEFADTEAVIYEAVRINNLLKIIALGDAAPACELATFFGHKWQVEVSPALFQKWCELPLDCVTQCLKQISYPFLKSLMASGGPPETTLKYTTVNNRWTTEAAIHWHPYWALRMAIDQLLARGDLETARLVRVAIRYRALAATEHRLKLLDAVLNDH